MKFYQEAQRAMRLRSYMNGLILGLMIGGLSGAAIMRMISG